MCNTGDIHINGLVGPYTMILIDGMPIVSGLSSVYGLSGIPNAMVERIEIVKGPVSSLYGSEAVGELINVITRKNLPAPYYFMLGMKKTRFTKPQIIKSIKEHENGRNAQELCRWPGLSSGTVPSESRPGGGFGSVEA